MFGTTDLLVFHTDSALRVQSSEDSETEQAKEEEQKADEEKNQKESATSTKGTNTPSGRPKHTDALKKSTASRKRMGSPNASDASGTDTSRKKVKNKHQPSHPPSQPISRPISPSAVQVRAREVFPFKDLPLLTIRSTRLVRSAFGILHWPELDLAVTPKPG